MADILQALIGSLPVICVTVLATLAITLIFKTSYTTNFAQGIISAFGCFIVARLFKVYDLPILVGLPIGMTVGIAVGVFIDTVIFRRGKNVNAIGQQIITMGLVSVFYGLISLLYNKKYVNGVQFGYFSTKQFVINGLNISANTLIGVLLTVGVTTLIFVCLYFTKWGLGVRATASNEYVAGMLGVNTHATTAISWAIACGIGTLAAVIYAVIPRDISAFFLTTIQVNSFMACILGGFSTFYGPVIAAIIIPLLTTLLGLSALIPTFAGISSWVNVIVYAIILLLILLKPQGLFGKKAVLKI